VPGTHATGCSPHSTAGPSTDHKDRAGCLVRDAFADASEGLDAMGSPTSYDDQVSLLGELREGRYWGTLVEGDVGGPHSDRIRDFMDGS
jgi:hypothetical protein